MEGMLEKGKKEKHSEQVQFAAYNRVAPCRPMLCRRSPCRATGPGVVPRRAPAVPCGRTLCRAGDCPLSETCKITFRGRWEGVHPKCKWISTCMGRAEGVPSWNASASGDLPRCGAETATTMADVHFCWRGGGGRDACIILMFVTGCPGSLQFS